MSHFRGDQHPRIRGDGTAGVSGQIFPALLQAVSDVYRNMVGDLHLDASGIKIEESYTYHPVPVPWSSRTCHLSSKITPDLLRKYKSGVIDQRYTWNSLGQLTRVDTNGSWTASFVYDGWGRHIAKSTGARDFYYDYDGEQVLQERSGINLIRLLPTLAELRLFDNSEEGDLTPGVPPNPRLVLHLVESTIAEICELEDVPRWAEPIVIAAIRLP